jgi:uncharacterized membrane protein YoaK (UPF0700 family)
VSSLRSADPTTEPTSSRRASSGGASSTARAQIALMLALTFSTGMIDAIGFLGLDKVFTGNMTGNVVLIGMALAGADDIPLLGPTLALVGFGVGAALGGATLRSTPGGWTRTTSALFVAAGISCIVTGVVLFSVDSPPGGVVALAATTVLGASMGLQAAAARALAVADLTTVVITSTIVGLAADQLSPTRRGRQPRRALAVVAMLLGALCGALLLQVHIGLALLLTGSVPVAVAVLGHPRARGRRRA